MPKSGVENFNRKGIPMKVSTRFFFAMIFLIIMPHCQKEGARDREAVPTNPSTNPDDPADEEEGEDEEGWKGEQFSNVSVNYQGKIYQRNSVSVEYRDKEYFPWKGGVYNDVSAGIFDDSLGNHITFVFMATVDFHVEAAIPIDILHVGSVKSELKWYFLKPYPGYPSDGGSYEVPKGEFYIDEVVFDKPDGHDDFIDWEELLKPDAIDPDFCSFEGALGRVKGHVLVENETLFAEPGKAGSPFKMSGEFYLNIGQDFYCD